MVKKDNNLENNGVSYSAKDIYVLEGLEPVRKRPGMYIGSTGVDGLHHLVWEVVDNSIDEAMGGFAKNIRVEMLKDNKISVIDDGRGIPVDIHAQTKKSALETVLTTFMPEENLEANLTKLPEDFTAWEFRWSTPFLNG